MKNSQNRSQQFRPINLFGVLAAFFLISSYHASAKDFQETSPPVSTELDDSSATQAPVSTVDSIFVFACEFYRVPSGKQVYFASGIYRDTLPNSAGMDSVLIISLTIDELPKTIDVSINNGISTLTSDSELGTYQWVDCAKGERVIPGATGRSYTPSRGGLYAVIVTYGNCVQKSKCIPVIRSRWL